MPTSTTPAMSNVVDVGDCQEGPRGPKRAQEAAKRPLGVDLGRFWTFLASLGGPFALFFLGFVSKRRPRGLLASIWDGFGRILGRVYRVLGGQNGEEIEIFGIYLDNNNFNTNNREMVKIAFFSMGGPSMR